MWICVTVTREQVEAELTALEDAHGEFSSLVLTVVSGEQIMITVRVARRVNP